MIDRTHLLSVTKQAKALGISRGCVYYRPKPLSEREQTLMNRIDRLHGELPFAGTRMFRALSRPEGVPVGRKHVATVMRRMGPEALYRKPRTTQRHPEHKVYPYLLRNLAITCVNQVWAMDVTYIPLAKGFVYLVAVVDWYTRCVLAWRVAITMDVQFCMEGRGAWRDTIFIERLWRSVKYEEVYLYAYDSVTAARAGLDRYFQFCNSRRPHSGLAARHLIRFT